MTLKKYSLTINMQIDFYFLQNQDAQGQIPFTCRLLDKIYHRGEHQIIVFAGDFDRARALDDMLWTFADTSFIPHTLADNPNNQQANIVISYDKLPDDKSDILINLSEQLLSDYQRFDRLLEIVPNEEPWRSNARQRFIHYRDQNLEIKTHKI